MNYQVEELIGKNNLKTLKVNGYFLHSKYNPINEARNFVEKNYEKYSTHILLGYGEGYIVEEFLNSFQYEEKLIIIDPLIEKGLLKIREQHQQHNKIIFFKSSEMKYFTDFLKENEFVKKQMEYQICCSMNYDKLFVELQVEIYKGVKELLYSNIININTLNRDASNWLINTFYNLSNTCKNFNLKELKQITSTPIVIASGGPSLTKQLELVKKNRQQIILIAAGSTINSLLREGIEPDYVVVIDGSELNENHFKHLKLFNTELIYSLSSYRGIHKAFESNKYCFLLTKDVRVNEIMQKKFNVDLPRIVGGGTVAHHSLSIANYISNGPIALIGQDLAYTDMKSHADGNEGFNQIINIDSDKYRYTDGYYGEQVLTDIVFHDMKRDFEKLIEILDKKDRIFNCTEGGVTLDGYMQMPFQQFLEKYVVENKISKEMQEMRVISESDAIRSYLNRFLKQFNLIKKEVIVGKKLLENKLMMDESILKKLKNKNKKLMAFIGDYPLDVGFEQLEFEGSRVFNGHKIDESEDENERIIKFTIKFYDRFLELHELLTPHVKIILNDMEKR